MAFVILLTSAITPVIGLIFITYYYTSSKRDVLCSVLLGFSLATALYGYDADVGNDIYRHMANLEYYRDLTFLECFGAGKLDFVYTWDVWSWVISKLGNDNLLQWSGAFVGYSIISFLVFNYSIRRGLSRKVWLTSLIISLLLVSPVSIAIGIRSANAFLICGMAIYGFFVQRHSFLRTAITFLIAVLLHSASIVIFFAWIIFPAFKKHKIIVSFTVVAVILLFSSNQHYLLAIFDNESSLSSLTKNTFDTIASYQRFDVMGSALIVTRAWQIVTAATILMRSSHTICKRDYRILPGGNQDNYNIKRLWDFGILLFIISCSLIFLIDLRGLRFFTGVSIVGMVPLLDSFNHTRFLSNKRCLVFDILLLVEILGSIFLYLHSMAWGTGSLDSLIMSLLFGVFSRGINI